MPAPKPIPGTITPTAAAALLGWSPYRIWKSAAAGTIKVVRKPGYPLLFDRASVETAAAELRPKPSGKGKRRPVKTAGA